MIGLKLAAGPAISLLKLDPDHVAGSIEFAVFYTGLTLVTIELERHHGIRRDRLFAPKTCARRRNILQNCPFAANRPAIQVATESLQDLHRVPCPLGDLMLMNSLSANQSGGLERIRLTVHLPSAGTLHQKVHQSYQLIPDGQISWLRESVSGRAGIGLCAISSKKYKPCGILAATLFWNSDPLLPVIEDEGIILLFNKSPALTHA